MRVLEDGEKVWVSRQQCMFCGTRVEIDEDDVIGSIYIDEDDNEYHGYWCKCPNCGKDFPISDCYIPKPIKELALAKKKIGDMVKKIKKI